MLARHVIKQAVGHFLHFHKGGVNVSLHVIGFTGLFYSMYARDWVLFGVFLVILETGHVYNHLAGIERYDFRPKVIFWRIAIFIVVVAGFFLVGRLFSPFF